MKLTPEVKNELEALYQRFFHDEKVRRMLAIPMHRGSNCFIHSFKVAKLAIKRASRHKTVNLNAILCASILHDYYLYDWRKHRELRKGHGRNHPFLAARQAYEDFNITDDVKRIIESHMWPLNFKMFPNSKEARIVSLADKAIATGEAFTSKKYKQKRKDKYIEYISHLFN